METDQWGIIFYKHIMFSSKTWKVSPRQLSTTTTTLPPSSLLFFHLTILLVFLSPTENHQSHKSKLGLWLRTTLLRQNNKRYQCTHTLHTSFFTSLHGVCVHNTQKHSAPSHCWFLEDVHKISFKLWEYACTYFFEH